MPVSGGACRRTTRSVARRPDQPDPRAREHHGVLAVVPRVRGRPRTGLQTQDLAAGPVTHGIAEVSVGKVLVDVNSEDELPRIGVEDVSTGQVAGVVGVHRRVDGVRRGAAGADKAGRDEEAKRDMVKA